MNWDCLTMIDEARQPPPRINGMAAKLREQYPHLNRQARQRLAREIAWQKRLQQAPQQITAPDPLQPTQSQQGGSTPGL
jgi:hypothetical protein